VISVIIPTLDDEAMLGRALHPLVPAAVAGLVREVIVADAGSTDASLEIADDAGCRILTGLPPGEGRARAAASVASSDWLMILDPSAQLLSGWESAVRGHIERGRGQAAFIPIVDPRETSFSPRALAAWSKRLFGARRSIPVLLVERAAYVSADPTGPMRRLAACAVLLKESG